MLVLRLDLRPWGPGLGFGGPGLGLEGPGLGLEGPGLCLGGPGLGLGDSLYASTPSSHDGHNTRNTGVSGMHM